MASDMKPDAIIAAYDYIALGAISALKENGYKIPGDFSIIGMDDINVASYTDTPLTTIQMHCDELCDKVVEIIFEKIKNKYYFLKQDVTINTKLIKRSSV